MNTKNKSKKSIGILLVAIMVTSVFVAMAPAASAAFNIVSPAPGTCMRGYWNVTLDKTLANDTVWKVNSTSVWADPCFRKWTDKDCDAAGCSYSRFDTNKSQLNWPGWPNKCAFNNVFFKVENETSESATAGPFSIDNVNPCIANCKVPGGTEDAAGNIWFNGSAPSDEIQANVTACDDCCGIHNVTWDTTLFETTVGGIKEFAKRGLSGNEICTGIEKCDGRYYDNTTVGTLKNCNVTTFTITARDNASDMAGVNNTATCTVKFGVDKTAPEKPNDPDPCCEEKAGAILVYWKAVADKGPVIPSGVMEYNVYVQDENKTAKAYIYNGTVKATDSGVYTCNGLAYKYKYEFKSNMGVVGNYSTFKINATDYALNRQLTLSNATEPQLLTQGPAADIDLVVPSEMEGCGTKPDTANVQATVKDEYGSTLGGIEVCFNTTDGQVCPTMNKTSNTCPIGVASSFFTPPKVVFMPYNVTVCAWVCANESIVKCENILIVPKQAENATIIAYPEMITAGAGENNESLIVVELVDVNGYPVGGSGNQDVCVYTDAGTFKSTGTWMVCGKMELGMFFAMLVSGDTPTLATVSADVGALYFPETTVTFAGFGNYDIPLYKGWNLISLPLVPDNADAGVVLEDIANELIEAWTYDGCEDEWTSGKFVPPAAWTGDLETMEVERGYWLEMNESATLTVTGYTMMPGNVPPPTYDVCEGWNLVGYYAIPPDKVMTAKKYFTEVTVSYKVLGFDGAPQGWVTVDKGDNLYSGKGYWMKAENDGEITPQEWV